MTNPDFRVDDQRVLEKAVLEQRLLASASQEATRRFSRVIPGGVAVMLLLLMAQMLYLNRDRAVVRHFAAAACQQIGCNMAPARNPGMISLSNRAFTEVEPAAGLYRLQLGLLNQAALAQPFPLIELSLTDSSGVIQARSLFHASDYLSAAVVQTRMAPDDEHIASFLLKTSAVNVSGFMVDFY